MTNALRYVLAAVECNNQAAARNQVHEPLEGCLHSFKICVNIRVIEFHVGQNQCVGKVVQKLWPFVEEGRIVLVALKDEGARGTKLEARSKDFRPAANQKRGLQRRRLARGNLIEIG